MKDGSQKGNGLHAKKVVIVCLFVLIVLFLCLAIWLVILNRNKAVHDDEKTGSRVSTLSKSERIYNELLSYSGTEGDNLRDAAVDYCEKQIDSLSEEDNVFVVVKPCSLFLLDNNYANDAIDMLNKIDIDKASEAELMTVYHRYVLAYEKLGDTEKSNGYNKKYEEARESLPGGL